MKVEVKCPIKKRFSRINSFWERLFHRFARGDIIQFPHLYGFKIGIFYGSYKMTEEQIHIQMISGWGKTRGFVQISEFLIYETEWKKAKIIRKCENFGSLYRVMLWSITRRDKYGISKL